MAALASCLSRSFLRKSRKVFDAENSQKILERSLNFVDLLAIGVGGTVGSGVFILTGLIAHDMAGPGVVISWLVAGFCCTFSALSYGMHILRTLHPVFLVANNIFSFSRAM